MSKFNKFKHPNRGCQKEVGSRAELGGTLVRAHEGLAYICHGRFSFVVEDLFCITLSYVRNPGGTSDLSKRKKRLVF